MFILVALIGALLSSASNAAHSGSGAGDASNAFDSAAGIQVNVSPDGGFPDAGDAMHVALQLVRAQAGLAASYRLMNTKTTDGNSVHTTPELRMYLCRTLTESTREYMDAIGSIASSESAYRWLSGLASLRQFLPSILRATEERRGWEAAEHAEAVDGEQAGQGGLRTGTAFATSWFCEMAADFAADDATKQLCRYMFVQESVNTVMEHSCRLYASLVEASHTHADSATDAAGQQTVETHQTVEEIPAADDVGSNEVESQHVENDAAVLHDEPTPDAIVSNDVHHRAYPTEAKWVVENLPLLQDASGGLASEQIPEAQYKEAFALALAGLLRGYPFSDMPTMQATSAGDRAVCSGYNAAGLPERLSNVIDHEQLCIVMQRARRLNEQRLSGSSRASHTAAAQLLRAIPSPPRDAYTNLRREAVRRGFLHAWRGYEQHAFGEDILQPLSKRASGDLCKMAMTLIDSLDTLLAVGALDEFERASAWIAQNFTVGGQRDINLFETTIRVVGGLLSAYHMSGHSHLLDGARSVMDAMIDTGAFDSPSGLPFGTLTLDGSTEHLPGPGVRGKSGYAYNPNWIGGSSSISEVGTLQVELLSLAATTGNMTYAKQSQKIMRQLYGRMPLDGLYPIYIDPLSGVLKDSVVTLGARGDSLYEYFLKQWVLLGGWSREKESWQALLPIAVQTARHNFAQLAVVVEKENGGAACSRNDPNSTVGTAVCEFADPTVLSPAVGIVSGLLDRAELDGSRYLLEMYNTAVCGITDRLLHMSEPSSMLYIVEQLQSVLATNGAPPGISHKMDHLVCFLPGTIALGLMHDAGHAAISRAKDQQVIMEVTNQMEMLPADSEIWRTVAAALNSSHSSEVLLSSWRHEVRRIMQEIRSNPVPFTQGNFSAYMPSASTLEANSKTTASTGSPTCPHASFFGSSICTCSVQDAEVARERLLEIARQLTQTCIAMYDKSTTGLAPEIITFHAGKDFTPNHDARHSLLRPETVESLFLMYRLTGDEAYRDAGWRIFTSLEVHARVPTGGYASVADVMATPLASKLWSAGAANQWDKMESFALAETFKYLYLLFSDSADASSFQTPTAEPSTADSRAPSDTDDERNGDGSIMDLSAWVYNTEAHPMPVLPARLSQLQRT